MQIRFQMIVSIKKIKFRIYDEGGEELVPHRPGRTCSRKGGGAAPPRGGRAADPRWRSPWTRCCSSTCGGCSRRRLRPSPHHRGSSIPLTADPSRRPTPSTSSPCHRRPTRRHRAAAALPRSRSMPQDVHRPQPSLPSPAADQRHRPPPSITT